MEQGKQLNTHSSFVPKGDIMRLVLLTAISILLVLLLNSSCEPTLQSGPSENGTVEQETSASCTEGMVKDAAGTCITQTSDEPGDVPLPPAETNATKSDDKSSEDKSTALKTEDASDDKETGDDTTDDQEEEDETHPVTPPAPESLFPGLDARSPRSSENSLTDFPIPFMDDGDRDYVLVWSSGSAGAACQINLDSVLRSMSAKRVFEEQLVESWDEMQGKNLVVIGNACNNRLAKEILGNPDPCDDGLVTGKGYVHLVVYDGEHYALLIMGKTNSDIVDACKVMGAGDLVMHGTEDSFDLEG
jgi:hypothetical protein